MAAQQAAADSENVLPTDATDNVNKDLEDDNMLPQDEVLDPEVIEAMIPRNLKIT